MVATFYYSLSYSTPFTTQLHLYSSGRPAGQGTIPSKRVAGLSDRESSDINVDSNGDIWLYSTDNVGQSRIVQHVLSPARRVDHGVVPYNRNFQSDGVRAVAIDSNDNVWIAIVETDPDNLSASGRRLFLRRFEIGQPLSSAVEVGNITGVRSLGSSSPPSVSAMAFDTDGALWIALRRFSDDIYFFAEIPDTSDLASVNLYNTESDSSISGISIDNDGGLWSVTTARFQTRPTLYPNPKKPTENVTTFGNLQSSRAQWMRGIAIFEPPPFSGLYTTGSPTIAGRFFRERVQGDTDDLTPIIPRIETKTYSIGMAVADILPIGNGGNGDLTYEIDCDAPGLTFTDRAIGGSPTTLGSYLATYTVTDEDGSEFTRQFYIVIGPAAVPALTLPQSGDKLYFLGDEIDETLPCARGGQSGKAYTLTPAIQGVQFSGDRRIKGEATAVGKTVHSYRVSDRSGIVRGNDFTIEVRSFEKRPSRMPSDDRFVESRIALNIEPVGTPGSPGYLRGFAFWNGTNNIEVDRVNYTAGEVVGLGSYTVDMQSSDPLTVLLEGADELFRAWLIAGGSGRPATITFLIREGMGDWDSDLKYVGRVGAINEGEGLFSLEVDSEIYIPSQAGVTRMSDESQRSIYPNDQIYKDLKTLAAGKKDVFPR